MGVREHGGGILHCYEFLDSKAGKIGWTFFLERNGMIEVEELFIMPAFRRSGYAAKLVKLIRDYSHERGASIRIWISHADTAHENIEIIKKFASMLGLALSASPERWASYVVGSTQRAAELDASGTSSPRAVRPSAPRISGTGKVHPLCSPVGF